MPSIDPTSNFRNVHCSKWDELLKQYFQPIPSLTKYHHFNFHTDGKIFEKLFSNSEEVKLQNETAFKVKNVLSLQNIKPVGLSLSRSWYLYDEICPLCFKKSSKDLVDPKPLIPKPKMLKNKIYNKQCHKS